MNLIHRHMPKMMSAIAAVETIDHPSDAALVAYARCRHSDIEKRTRP